MDELLKSWGFSEEICQKFAENDIVPDLIPNLSMEILKEIIPSVGTRIRLMKKIQEYIMDLNLENCQDLPNWNSPSTSTASTETVDSSCALENNTFLNLAHQKDTDILISLNDIDFDLLTRPPTYPDFDLKEVLSKAPEGKSILTYYDKKNILDEKHSNRLVDIICRHIYDHIIKHRLTQAEYQSITKKITELFPKETFGSYYVPGAKRIHLAHGRTPYAHGKLVNKVRNIVKRSDDATPIRKRKSTEQSEAPYSSSKITIVSTADCDLEANEDYVWLKVHNDPWDTVIQKWKQTYFLRRSNYNCSVSIEQFLQKWPILKDLRSESLIESDFIHLYPNSILSLHMKWDIFFSTICSLKKSSVTDSTALNLIDLLESTENEDGKCCLQLSLLPYLVPPTGRKKTSEGGVWKYSIIEAREGILVHVKDLSLIDEAVERIQSQAVSHKQTVQPYLLIVGDLHSPSTYFIVVDTIKYQFTSAKKALDFLFKYFHVVSAKYPVQSEYLWLLIQKSIYNIDTIYDKVPSCLLKLLALLKEAIN